MNDWIEILTLGMPPAHRKAAINFMWRAAVTFHIAWACGWLASIGASGFASASDLHELQESQMQAGVEILESRIFDTFTRQCTAETVEAKRFYAQQLLDLRLKYMKLAKREYPRLPDCTAIK